MAHWIRLLCALPIAFGGLTAGASVAARARAAELIVADFNSGAKPNNVGGDFGAWIKDPADPMQGCIESFDPANRFGGKGNALRIIYSVASAKPAYGGLWMRLQNLNATKFDNIAFRVKGDAALGYTRAFKVELKDAVAAASHHYVRGVTDQWQDIVIPLKDLQGTANLARLQEFVIVFEDTTATAKQGVVYLDDVRFTRNPR
jgi:Carbohydrate binding domain (family 11)